MQTRMGVSRQQYQRLEASGNPSLNTLELVSKGLNSEMMLIPQEERDAVLALLSEHTAGTPSSDMADDSDSVTQYSGFALTSALSTSSPRDTQKF